VVFPFCGVDSPVVYLVYCLLRVNVFVCDYACACACAPFCDRAPGDRHPEGWRSVVWLFLREAIFDPLQQSSKFNLRHAMNYIGVL